jgi:hypothetical protein
MPSMTRYLGGGALAERVAALEAERLAPVPRASRAVGVDADDLAVVLDYLRTIAAGPRGKKLPADVVGGDVVAAYWRLDAAVRSHAGQQP